MWTPRFEAIAAAAVLAAAIGAAPAPAEHPDEVSCRPVATCEDGSTSPDQPACPDGHACVCVPSCPVCADCATQVCVPVAIACHGACDCPDGMGCAHGACSADAHPIHCCDGEVCPAGERCQNRDGTIDVCGRPDECRTACDCSPGLGCFEGQCIAGFAPVFCCEGDVCPARNQCQHRDGRMDRCGEQCIEQAWLCREDDSGNSRCGDNRVCSCTASCPDCEDCGTNVCVPPGSPTPYRCGEDGTCAQPLSLIHI